MEKEYKIKSVEMVSPNYSEAFEILNRTVEVLNIPDGATTVQADIFESLTTLKHVIIPVSVTRLESMCFYDCTNLTIVEYKGTIEQWKKIYKGYSAFKGIGTTEVICLDGNISLEGV